MAIGYEGYERIDGTAGNGSVSTITIPSGTTAAVIFHSMWDGDAPPVTGFTVDSQSATIYHATNMVGNSNTTFVATVDGFSTGTNKTLSWTYTTDGTITEGGFFYVVWFSGASATPVATDEDRQDGAVATITLNNTATTQVAVVHLCKWGSATAITTPSGATANNLVNDSSDNSDFSDLTYYTFSTTGSKNYVSDTGQNGLMGALLEESTATDPTITGTFSNRYASTQGSLSGLSWAWFDENIGALNAPTASGAVETTDDSGAFSIDVTGTSLTAGQTGTLVVYDSTGGKYGAYRAIVGANGSLRLDNPGLASSYYLDSQSGVIPNIVTPPMGPWR